MRQSRFLSVSLRPAARAVCAAAGAIFILAAPAAIGADVGHNRSGVGAAPDGDTNPATNSTVLKAKIGDDGRHNRNGIGADPDGDTNPATNSTILKAKIGDAAEAAYDATYTVITFEPPPGKHNGAIRKQYLTDSGGVWFSRGLDWQICEGQRYFEYDTRCTYLSPPSGSFAAVYEDEFNRPLRIRFKNPVCASAVAVYPTGGEEGELFELTMQPFDSDENELDEASTKFKWTQDTFRWRLGVHAYFLDQPAARVDVSIRSLKKGNKRNPVSFLIDDLAYIENTHLDTVVEENSCATMLAEIKAEITETGASPDGDEHDGDDLEYDINDDDHGDHDEDDGEASDI